MPRSIYNPPDGERSMWDINLLDLSKLLILNWTPNASSMDCDEGGGRRGSWSWNDLGNNKQKNQLKMYKM